MNEERVPHAPDRTWWVAAVVAGMLGAVEVLAIGILARSALPWAVPFIDILGGLVAFLAIALALSPLAFTTVISPTRLTFRLGFFARGDADPGQITEDRLLPPDPRAPFGVSTDGDMLRLIGSPSWPRRRLTLAEPADMRVQVVRRRKIRVIEFTFPGNTR